MSDLKKYEYVIAVAECGGFSNAAQILNIAQPTLSRFIKSVELELGAELFDRRELPIRLTPLGKSFVEAGRKLIYIEKQLEKKVAEHKGRKNSVIKIGISPSRSPYMTPLIAEEFIKRLPDVRLTVEERTTAELAKRLDEGELDLIISLFDESTEHLSHERLFYEEVLLAVKRELAPTADAVEVLKSVPTVSVGRGQAMWHSLFALSKKLGFPEPKIECQSIESALALARRGLGATLVPSYVMSLGAENDSLLFLPLPSGAFENTRSVCLFWKNDEFLTDSQRELIKSIKNLFSKN